ncbi:tyrosine-type recombinase/integrase [Embleya scabrispora]|uniref:tyrosine-type recombinase/integrase n=1 Tax=Embleya scabrispora TaxID=159449 RepID=UPI001FE12930|nr:tyrosine-type recombinase/integrase [Embleya scabrispora]
MLDRKTSEHVDLLFALRARRVAKTYVNRTIIPALCRKAGVPNTDVRGNITSHRARSTIVSRLYNAKEPMTLFELQAWLGHRSPESPQHYAKITPNTLARAYNDAGYFARNVRTIESSSTATRSPRAPPPAATPGSTSTSATAGAPTHLRAMSAPHGLRPLRLLHPEGLQQRAAA